MRKFLAAFGACIVLVAQGCAPPMPAAAPSGPATPAPAGSADAVPHVLMDEHFGQAWPDDPRGSAMFTSGGYLVSARVPGQFVAIRAPLVEIPSDVTVRATFRKVSGPPGGGYGLIVRDQRTSSGDGVDQAGEYIVAEVGDRGETGIWRRDGDRWTDLVDWTPSAAVHVQDDVNELTAAIFEDRLTFLANGQQVATLDVHGIRPGGVGIFVGGDQNAVLVDRFQVETPRRPAVAAPSQPPLATSAAPPAVRPAAAQTAPVRPAAQSPTTVPASADAGLAEAQRLRAMVSRLLDDVSILLSSFADGFDGPHSPINDPSALNQAASRLGTATSSAEEVLSEVERVRNGVGDASR